MSLLSKFSYYHHENFVIKFTTRQLDVSINLQNITLSHFEGPWPRRASYLADGVIKETYGFDTCGFALSGSSREATDSKHSFNCATTSLIVGLWIDFADAHASAISKAFQVEF